MPRLVIGQRMGRRVTTGLRIAVLTSPRFAGSSRARREIIFSAFQERQNGALLGCSDRPQTQPE